ncbi:MAG: recombinase family protein [Bacteroidetes bacterium]|nr:recombinase family protein [Bacteroidota bacterium]
MANTKSVGIWLRVSTEDQVENDSLEHHEARARSYADSKGWDVFTVYRLEAVSGKSVMNHSETKRMLKDAKDGNITGLIFSKLARLSRNLKELLEFSEVFEATKTDLISLGENIDTSSPAGRLFFSLSGIFGQYEREEIASRVAASVPIRAKLGKQIGGQASYGYQWKDNKLIVSEKEAPVRKLIYELFLKHRRKKSTAKELNDLGYRTRNGSKWSDTTIDRLIRDTTAKGEYRANYTKSLGDKKNWVLKDPSEWIITSCPAIVEPAVWNECNRILDEQFKKRKKVGPKAVHLLAGFVYCTCGKKMYVFHENNVYACKPCKNRIPVADLDEIYHLQLKAFLLTDVDVKSYIEKSNKAISEKEKLLKTITKDADKLSKKMTELVNMRIGGELTKEAFLNHHKPLEDRVAQLNDQIPQLQGEIDFLKVQSLSSETVLSEAKDLYQRWPKMEYEEKRTIVEVITEAITIDKEDIRIKLSYLPTSPTPPPTLLLPIIVGNKQRHHDVVLLFRSIYKYNG